MEQVLTKLECVKYGLFRGLSWAIEGESNSCMGFFHETLFMACGNLKKLIKSSSKHPPVSWTLWTCQQTGRCAKNLQ